jgi:hypothetical protein
VLEATFWPVHFRDVLELRAWHFRSATGCAKGGKVVDGE